MNGNWVDTWFLKGPGPRKALTLGATFTTTQLREHIEFQQQRLTEAGLLPRGTAALRLPPSLASITTLLAAWRIGAQVSLIDYRLTEHEAAASIARINPQVVVAPDREITGRLRGYFETGSVITTRPDGAPADTDHVLLQLSSGSTGPSKVIGRTATSLIEEVERYRLIDGFPGSGERIVVLASIIHVLGLVGGLLYGLHHDIHLVLPSSHTVDAIHHAVAADPAPTTILGVPAQAGLLSAVQSPPPLPQLKAMVVGGDRLKTEVWQRFTNCYGVPLGLMYGMTEAGVIASDLNGALRPHLTLAPGISVRIEDGEILLRLDAGPYVGQTDPSRYVDGWLRTKDAGTLDPDTGLLSVHGRLDQQVSVAGLKVDLLEVEELLSRLPGVRDAVVVHGAGIEAYVAVSDGDVTGDLLSETVAARLAAYKRPRRLHILPAIPRTATGKPLRNPEALRAAARAAVTL
ncbi:class I adenylate-forming enzyme family protein [Streptomyces sp. NPDC005355]|uniref:class I adenylate-forming enzyme family protein n=1 Tax=Streptomyces sp. NPDC005355 TaxID=3157038 RepID=UPI0033AC6684